jgi:hypothetical protein
MAGATTTTLATAIQTIFAPQMRKTFYEGTPLMRLLGIRPSLGGDSHDWKVNYAGNAGRSYSEGDAPGPAGNQAFADLSLAHSNFDNTVQISGHARDAMKNGYFNGVEKEMMGGISGLMHTVETAMVTQFIAAINDDTTYAGQTRTTVHTDSDVTAGGTAALTLAMLSEMYETLTLDPRAVEYNNPKEFGIISSQEQLTAYTEIGTGITQVGSTDATGPNYPYATMSTDQILDAGKLKHTVEYNRIPWFVVPTMTNTYVFLTKMADVFIEESRSLTIDPLGKIDDTDRWLLTWGGVLVHEDPYRAGRIEALTT